jgi:membrane protease YdiL (CAAX protease family)
VRPSAPSPVQKWPFVTACAAAGGLAVPLHAVATPVSAAFAGLSGLLGLYAWRWSNLPRSTGTDAPSGVERLAQPAVWMGLGLAVGLLLLGVIRFAGSAMPAVGTRIAAASTLPIWRRLLIVYVAAVSEELLFRLLLLSVVAGLMARIFRLPGGVPTRAVIWAATGLSALAFAAAHLPAWSAVVPLSVGLALSILTLNAVGGLALGYLFVKRGIMAAMWMHAGADCAIQLLGPLTR